MNYLQRSVIVSPLVFVSVVLLSLYASQVTGDAIVLVRDVSNLTASQLSFVDGSIVGRIPPSDLSIVPSFGKAYVTWYGESVSGQLKPPDFAGEGLLSDFSFDVVKGAVVRSNSSAIVNSSASRIIPNLGGSSWTFLVDIGIDVSESVWRLDVSGIDPSMLGVFVIDRVYFYASSGFSIGKVYDVGSFSVGDTIAVLNTPVENNFEGSISIVMNSDAPISSGETDDKYDTVSLSGDSASVELYMSIDEEVVTNERFSLREHAGGPAIGVVELSKVKNHRDGTHSVIIQDFALSDSVSADEGGFSLSQYGEVYFFQSAYLYRDADGSRAGALFYTVNIFGEEDIGDIKVYTAASESSKTTSSNSAATPREFINLRYDTSSLDILSGLKSLDLIIGFAGNNNPASDILSFKVGDSSWEYDWSGKVRVLVAPGDAIDVVWNGNVIDAIPVLSSASQMVLTIDTDKLYEGVLSGGNRNFYVDTDRDGVPDSYEKDSCKNSDTAIVDVMGCSCSQLSCKSFSSECKVDGRGPHCVQTCFDGIQNQDESGIDCGGVCNVDCAPKKDNSCSYPDTCLSAKPWYCSSEKKVVANPGACGCPDGFDTQGDSCIKVVPSKGLKCVQHDMYKFFQRKVDCSSVMKNGIRIPLENVLSLKVKGFPSFVKDKLKKKFKKDIRNEATVCMPKVDIGCVPRGLTCPSEDFLKKFSSGDMKDTVKNTIESEANKYLSDVMKKQFPSIIRSMLKIAGVKTSIDADITALASLQLSEEYDCPDQVINSAESCIPLVVNGPSDVKADIFVVGEQFTSQESFQGLVSETLDYDNKNKDGLFDEEPFKSHRESFNIFTKAIGELPSSVNPDSPDEGALVEWSALTALQSWCPQADQIMMFSSRYFRSRALPSDTSVGLSQNSLASGPRTVLHEFGHQFGKLEDEYTQTKSSSSSLGFDLSILDSSKKFMFEHNCALPEDVSGRWGGIPGYDGSTFVGCGGDCTGSGCTTFVRPTFNSVMRNQRLYCSGTSEDSCTNGPRNDDPSYDSFGPVNYYYLQKELEKYDNAPAVSSIPDDSSPQSSS